MPQWRPLQMLFCLVIIEEFNCGTSSTQWYTHHAHTWCPELYIHRQNMTININILSVTPTMRLYRVWCNIILFCNNYLLLRDKFSGQKILPRHVIDVNTQKIHFENITIIINIIVVVNRNVTKAFSRRQLCTNSTYCTIDIIIHKVLDSPEPSSGVVTQM